MFGLSENGRGMASLACVHGDSSFQNGSKKDAVQVIPTQRPCSSIFQEYTHCPHLDFSR